MTGSLITTLMGAPGRPEVTVHWTTLVDDHAQQVQGEIVAAWLEAGLTPDHEYNLMVSVRCTDRRFRQTALMGVKYGPIPADPSKKPRTRENVPIVNTIDDIIDPRD